VYCNRKKILCALFDCLRGDRDLPGLLGRGLWNSDSENTILQARLNIVMVNRTWTLEGPGEAANGSLCNPVAQSIRVSVLCHFLVVIGGSDFGGLLLFVSSSVFFVFHSLNCSAFPLFRAMFCVAGDGQSVVVAPLNIDVGLFDARQLTLKLICLFSLLDVEAWVEGAPVGVCMSR